MSSSLRRTMAATVTVLVALAGATRPVAQSGAEASGSIAVGGDVATQCR